MAELGLRFACVYQRAIAGGPKRQYAGVNLWR